MLTGVTTVAVFSKHCFGSLYQFPLALSATLVDARKIPRGRGRRGKVALGAKEAMIAWAERTASHKKTTYRGIPRGVCT